MSDIFDSVKKMIENNPDWFITIDGFEVTEVKITGDSIVFEYESFDVVGELGYSDKFLFTPDIAEEGRYGFAGNNIFVPSPDDDEEEICIRFFTPIYFSNEEDEDE